MSLHRLDVVPSDVAATALGYRVDEGPAPDALVTTVLEHPTGECALRLSILGASHAVTLVADGRDVVTEEVSCHAADAGGGPLPADARCAGAWGSHHLSGSTATVSTARFAALTAELTDLADGDGTVLAGCFPGGDGALTVVAATAETTGWSWRTWHLYPSTGVGDPAGADDAGGDVVTTESRLEVAGLGGPATGLDRPRALAGTATPAGAAS